jgi:hypothetical protein
VQHLDPQAVTGAPAAVELSSDEGIELLWDAPQTSPPPSPWRATDGGWAWHLAYDPDAPVPDDELPSPLPTLVTIGARDGRQLLVNMEAMGSVSVTGDDGAVDDFLRAVVLELSTDDELADSYVTVCGCDFDDLSSLERVQIADAPGIHHQLESASVAAREAIGETTSFVYRTGPRGGHLEARVAVVRTPDKASAAQLIAAARPHCGVAVLVTGSLEGVGGRITLDGSGGGRIDPLGVEFRPVGVPQQTAEETLSLLTEEPLVSEVLLIPQADLDSSNGDTPPASTYTGQSVQGTAVANGSAPATNVAESDLRLHEPSAIRLLVQVLGRPAVPDRPDLGRRELVLTTYLACKGRPISTASVMDAVWNGRAVQDKTVWNLIGRTRTALGTFEDGTPVMPPVDRLTNSLRLSDGVVTDIQLLRSRVDQATASSSARAIELLRGGLSVVHGPPFDAAGYDWAHHTEQYVAEASALIENAAEALVKLALAGGDIDLAREALVHGLRGMPGNEVLYRARMRLEYQAGNLAGVDAAYSELNGFLTDLASEPCAETVELFRRLTGRTHRV